MKYKICLTEERVYFLVKPIKKRACPRQAVQLFLTFGLGIAQVETNKISQLLGFTSFSVDQVRLLTQKHHIYLLNSGRINVCGITHKNVDYVGRAIHDVVTNTSAHL